MPNRPESTESLQAREAFETFYAMSPEQRAKPTNCYVLLAQQFKVTGGTVQHWAQKNRWAARARERDDRVMDKVAEENMKSAVETKIFYHDQLHQLAREWFRARMEQKDLRQMTLATMKVSDLRAIIELDLSIMSDRQLLDYLNGTQNSEKDAQEQAKGLTTDQLQALAGTLDAPRAKNKPVAITSGASGTGVA